MCACLREKVEGQCGCIGTLTLITCLLGGILYFFVIKLFILRSLEIRMQL